MTKIELHSLEETKAFGEKLGSLLFGGAFITMSGDLGAGKTTLTKAIGKAIGIKKTINSPTFTILKSYYGKINLHHIDAYRLEGITQDLGFEELFEEEDSICIVEWPHFIEYALPSERLELTIKIEEDKRIVEVNGIGAKYAELEEKL